MATTRYCLNASTIRPTPLMDKIRIAGRAGYEAIELWHDEMGEYVAQGGTLQEIKKALGDAGLEVPTTIAAFGWLGSEGRARQQALDEVKRRMEEAAEIGATYIVASPPREALDLSGGGADYRELVEIGRRIGVRPAMEYLGFVDSVYTIDQAWQIVVDSDCEDASLIMDPFHILRGGGPIDSIAKVPGDKVAIWHWNDVPDTLPVRQQSDADRVLPGDGVGPLRQIEKLAQAQGYRGYVSLELFNPGLWEEDPVEVARIGLEKMQAYFAD